MYEEDIGALHASTMALVQDVSGVLTLCFARELKYCCSLFPRKLREIFLWGAFEAGILPLLLEVSRKLWAGNIWVLSGPTSYECDRTLPFVHKYKRRIGVAEHKKPIC